MTVQKTIAANAALFDQLQKSIEQTIVGQERLINRLLITVLTGGHLLIEGPPGLAKTTAVKALANGLHSEFQRIQFTPDLMPADLTGSDIYNQKTGEFRFLSGPLFHEMILADEINRAPPKVQSALLEAMEERQITIGNETHILPELYMVIATQNPLEQSGTYPLPEAQLDRFQLHVTIDYPDQAQELEILERSDQGFPIDSADNVLSPEQVLATRAQLSTIHVEDSIKRYIVALVTATRNSEQYLPDMKNCIRAGASPRASKALLCCARAQAFLAQRDYVTADDIFELCNDVLRHRILLSFEAAASKITTDDLIKQLLNKVPSP
ncbi:MoxR-like ATPase in aerotolerance operon [hydrothermal vent metagenome]|uniref:MoxR-like ATPase in aerotolerance operon n=1 Tax=hydrothermal vent metagenome TaxID=652676 RepID=A0A3B0YS19_9ZZZZ